MNKQYVCTVCGYNYVEEYRTWQRKFEKLMNNHG